MGDADMLPLLAEEKRIVEALLPHRKQAAN